MVVLSSLLYFFFTSSSFLTLFKASQAWRKNKMDESKHEIHSQVDAITAGTASMVNLTAGKNTAPGRQHQCNAHATSAEHQCYTSESLLKYQFNTSEIPVQVVKPHQLPRPCAPSGVSQDGP